MNIYLDENIPQKIARRLKEEGYQITYVPRGMGDSEILAKAYSEDALLITSDKDFERLILNEHRPTAGVILLRIATRVPIEDRAKIVINLLRRYKDKLQGACTLLSETAIDIRRPLS